MNQRDGEIMNPNGEIVIGNASENAIFRAQDAMRSVAEKMGIASADDVQTLVNKERYGEEDA